MALDVVWLLSGLVLWTPLISPLTELRHPSPAVRCIYLFLAAGAIVFFNIVVDAVYALIDPRIRLA